MGVPMWRISQRNRERRDRDPGARVAYYEALHMLREVLPARFRPMHFASAGYRSVEDLRRASDLDLLEVPQIGVGLLRQLRAWLAAHPPAPVVLPWWVAEE